VVSGLQFLSLGIISEFLVRIYHETQAKSAYVIESTTVARPRLRRRHSDHSGEPVLRSTGTANGASENAIRRGGARKPRAAEAKAKR
jgi:hypothetical protein